MGKDEETNEIKLRSDTRRKRLRCASDIIIRCSTLDVRCSMFNLFNVGRSSFKTTLYGRNVTCGCLQNNLALTGFIPAQSTLGKLVSQTFRF
jgi:hypothetical protein